MAHDANGPSRFSTAPAFRKVLASACALALAGSCAAFPAAASAEDIDTNPTPDELQLRVERTAAEYDEALVQADEAAAAIEEHDARIAELEKLIPI